MDKFKQRIDKLIHVAFEQWPKHGIRLLAVSANANGAVNSGLTKQFYFYRLGSEFIVERR